MWLELTISPSTSSSGTTRVSNAPDALSRSGSPWARCPKRKFSPTLTSVAPSCWTSTSSTKASALCAQGDPDLLRASGAFETRVVPLLEVDGEIVSSSHIRGLVAGGALEYAGTLLGTPFTIDGPVEHGDKRGRTLGFPTANLVPREGYCTPGHGVYACRARTADGEWPAAVNVGVRPMFESGRGELIEAYLLDFDGDLYDQPLRLEFLKRLRGERRFDSVDGLVEQMGRDVEQTRAIASPAA